MKTRKETTIIRGLFLLALVIAIVLPVSAIPSFQDESYQNELMEIENSDQDALMDIECELDLIQITPPVIILPPEPCTPGATWCESHGCGARMSTCGAGGTWGPWVGCGRYSACTNNGYGGTC